MRLFNAGARAVDEPQTTIGGTWAVDSAQSATNFSGVAYFFGKDLRKALGVLPHLALMHFRAEMEYRGAFWINRVAQIITYASSFAVIWIIADRFGGLGGWSWAELALLFPQLLETLLEAMYLRLKLCVVAVG